MALNSSGYVAGAQSGSIGIGGIEGKGAITTKYTKFPLNKFILEVSY